MRGWNDSGGQEDRALNSRAAHRLQHRRGSAIGRAILRQFIRLCGLRDSAVGHGVQTTWNARRWVPRIPIDHVVISPEVLAVSSRVGPNVSSDHLVDGG